MARGVTALGAIDVTGSLTGVVQRIGTRSTADGARDTRAAYRGDVTATFPGGAAQDVEGKLFAHVRFGEGRGIALRPTFTSTANTTAFQPADGADRSYAIVAQAWYQLGVLVPSTDAAAGQRARIEVTAGKIDPFAFFDQNAVADDETTRFMNNAFVHNPLLDSGGDAGVDRYGFTPGMRVAYVDTRDDTNGWSAALGVFGSAPGARWTGPLRERFVIAQLETTRRVVAGQPGTWRLYAWNNGRAADFDGEVERRGGFGLSIDQRTGETVTLFARAGRTSGGHVRFDRAWTIGAEIAGDAWRRARDAAGIAAGFLRTSDAFRERTADTTFTGYAASGTERIAEIYYRWRIGSHCDVAPDVQWIRRPGGDGTAPAIVVAGVRARVGF